MKNDEKVKKIIVITAIIIILLLLSVLGIFAAKGVFKGKGAEETERVAEQKNEKDSEKGGTLSLQQEMNRS